MQTLKTEYRLELEGRAKELNSALGGGRAFQTMERLIKDIHPRETCIVSSFGAESAVILHLASQIDPSIHVLFLDTHKLFPETLEYRDHLADILGLSNVKTIYPNPDHLNADDPSGTAHRSNADLCCHIRKTQPLISALSPFKVWVSGRKRHHGGSRSDLPRVEVQDGKLKFNPLFDWSREEIRNYLIDNDLPRHPLVDQGYPSIGCLPCTIAVDDPLADPRAGRWAGEEKTECGIHISAEGVITRSADT